MKLPPLTDIWFAFKHTLPECNCFQKKRKKKQQLKPVFGGGGGDKKNSKIKSFLV
jgi:hypothetical protein